MRKKKKLKLVYRAISVSDPCNPSRCGSNTKCRVVNGLPVCSCQANFIGSPPNCRPECVLNSECPLNKACDNQKCVDPCPKPCGLNAICRVINHSPICSCKSDYTGDPFSICTFVESKIFIFHIYFLISLTF